MNQIESFQTLQRYYDDINFPYGIGRSGDFTRTQSELIEKHGVALHALCNGIKDPATEEEARFVRVCQGIDPAESPLERAWIVYLRAINRRHEYISHTGSPVVSGEVSESDEVVD